MPGVAPLLLPTASSGEKQQGTDCHRGPLQAGQPRAEESSPGNMEETSAGGSRVQLHPRRHVLSVPRAVETVGGELLRVEVGGSRLAEGRRVSVPAGNREVSLKAEQQSL